MSNTLDVSLYGYQIGTLRRLGSEEYVLEYDLAWASANEAIPLSLSLPLSSRTHSGPQVANFIDNLLPDNPEVRQRWATDAGLDTVEPFFLLEVYGEDVAGAASFRKAGAPETRGKKPSTDADIAERIRLLREDETAWHDGTEPPLGQFSLGGVQTKFSLARHDDKWFESTGADASTHLFKPQVTGVRDGELIEYLIMRTASNLGLPSANVELFDHGGQHSLVVERFDRQLDNDGIVRLHQEDVLQALGEPRLRKYQTNNGPGIDNIAELLKKFADQASRERYAAMLLFSWLVLSTDGHAKNCSIFIEPDGAKLTPLYDASSVIPYLGKDRTLDVESLLIRASDQRMAVKYGASYRVGDAGRFELEVIARQSGMPADDLQAIIALIIIEISSVMTKIASDMPAHLQTDTVARAVEWMPLRVTQAAESLGLGGLL